MISDEVPVVLGFDRRYILPSLCAIYSIIKSSRREFHTFYALHDDISEHSQRAMSLFVEKLGATITFIDISTYLRASNLNVIAHWTSSIYARLFSFSLFREFDYFIFFESDMLAIGDIYEALPKENTACNFPIRSVRDTIHLSRLYQNAKCDVPNPPSFDGESLRQYYIQVLGLNNPFEVINPGFLVVQPALVTDKQLEEIASLLKYNKIGGTEAEILNRVFRNNVDLLKDRYNYFTGAAEKRIKLQEPDQTHREQEGSHAVVYHYADRPKPWEDANIPHGAEYQKVLEDTLALIEEIGADFIKSYLL